MYASPTASSLSWGTRYAMVEPSHFRIDYVINPFMDPTQQPDSARAMRQWQTLVRRIEDLGAAVDVLPQRADAPDMVYAMNLGLALTSPSGEPRMALSHMRHPQRRMETDSARTWFERAGVTTEPIPGTPRRRPHFEAGDAFPFGDALLVGYGPRTEESALQHLATQHDIRVRGLRITHPGMYHLDLAFCPLDSETALVCPDALDASSAAALLDLVPNPIVLTEDEALTTFAANSVVVGRTVLMPDCPPRLHDAITGAGFHVEICNVSEFHLGGGSIRCLTNPLDIVVGRDLPYVAGGEVILPHTDAEPGRAA